jgi:hypothetical protein
VRAAATALGAVPVEGMAWEKVADLGRAAAAAAAARGPARAAAARAAAGSLRAVVGLDWGWAAAAAAWAAGRRAARCCHR